MDISGDDPGALQEDKRDLFSAVNELGGLKDEYDAAVDDVRPRFKRGDAWREAMRAIRKILKKYHGQEGAPAVCWLASMDALRSRVIPMIVEYPERELLYDVGKVLLYITTPPKSTSARGHIGHSTALREAAQSMLSVPGVLLLFVGLLGPALEPDVPGTSSKSEQDINCVDLVVSLLKQLLEVPNGRAAQAQGLTESLVVALADSGALGVMGALCQLVERREFRRVTPALMSMYFQAFRGQDASAIVSAHKEMAARAASDAAAAAARKAAAAAGSKRSRAAPMAVPSRAANSKSDPLLRASEGAHAARAKDAAARARRWAGAYVVPGVGSTKIVSAPLSHARVTSIAQRLHPDAARRGGPRRTEEDVLSAALELVTDDGIGTSEASRELVTSARAALYNCAISLLQAGTAVTDREGDDEDGGDGAVPLLSGFFSLTTAVKARLIRDADDLEPADLLRYLHFTGTVAGIHRLSEVARIKSAKDASAKAAREAGAGAAAEASSPPGLSLAQLEPLLDRWSFSRIVQVAGEALDRKRWPAVAVVIGHVKEVILLVHAALEHGDDEAVALAEQVVDGLFRDYDVPELIPKLMRAYAPGRFTLPTMTALVEAAHYTLKLAERAAAAGVQTAKSKKKRKGVGASRKEGDGDDAGAGSDGDGGGAAAVGGAKAERPPPAEQAFDAAKYVGEFVHPAIIQLLVRVLSAYSRNGPKANYYATHLFRRICDAPNDLAGTHPRTGAQLTFRVMTYHWSVVQLASGILSDKRAAAAAELADVRAWALSFSRQFIADARENPLIAAEALFWRPDRASNADLAGHYGLIHGIAIGQDMSAEQLREMLQDRKKQAAAAAKPRSKLAQEFDEAEAEARRLASRGVDDDGEASLRLSDSDGDRRSPRRGGGGGGRKSGSDSDSASSESSGSRKSARSGSSSGGRRKAAAGRDQDRQKKAGGSSSGSSSDGGAPRGAPQRRLLQGGGRKAAAAVASDSDDGGAAAVAPPRGGQPALAWTAADDDAIRVLFPLYCGVDALAAHAQAPPPARPAPAAAAADDDGFDEEEDDDAVVMSSRRGGAAAGGLAAAGKGAADSAGSAGGGPALAGALLCADRAFAGRPGFTPATLAARAATLGLHPAPAAAAAGAPSQAVKRARIAAASRAAAAGVLRSAAAAVADDSWDAVADDAAAAGGAAAATAAAETLALDDPQNGSPEPLQFVASQLRRAARERQEADAAFAPHLADPSGEAFLAAAAADSRGVAGSGSNGEDDAIGGYGPAAAHAAMRAVLGLPALPRPGVPLRATSEAAARWLGHPAMAPLLREAGCVQQQKAALPAIWAVPSCVPPAALLAAAREIEATADALEEE